MTDKIIDVGTRHAPTLDIEKCAAIHNYNPCLYINAGSHDDELHQLRNHPTIRDFASVKPDTYELIKATNKTLLLFIDLAKQICAEERV